MGIIDLDKQFTFYASYHHDRLNKLIHILCVWPILWSAFVLAQYSPLEISTPISIIHPVNLSLFAAIFYAGAYILMEKKAGTLAAVLVFFCLFTGREFFLNALTWTGYPAWQLALAVQAFAWIFQFVGHGVFEGRAPALFDNLMQAFVMAPMFVLLEILFAFGYRKDFQSKLWRNVEREIAKLKVSDKKTKGNKRRQQKMLH